MKNKMIMTVAAAVFLNVSGVYADTMFGLGGTVFFGGDGEFGLNAIMPQVGWTSAKHNVVTRRATAADEVFRGLPRGMPIEEFTGMEFDGFDWSVLFDLTVGFSLPEEANVSTGLTAEFYFLTGRLGTLGAGLGGGWGFLNFIDALTTTDSRPNPYGAPYVRATVPYIFLGLFKTGAYFDYYLTDDPYTQFNMAFMLLF
jgi:hypothetical protein